MRAVAVEDRFDMENTWLDTNRKQPRHQRDATEYSGVMQKIWQDKIQEV